MFYLPDLLDFEIVNLKVAETIQLTLHPSSAVANCPLCAAPAHRSHSRYTRTLADLPVRGKPLALSLLVRRFYCDNAACVRHIFAERFTSLTQAYAQRTNQLANSLLQLGLALGGEAGASLAQKLGLPTSPDTLLRLVKNSKVAVSEAVPTPPTKVGIDDWSWKRGVNFGTIVVDLDSHQVVDLLKDRSVETVSAWLKQNPQLEVISRDRSSEYALAATQGAPQAVQVADRFHIVRNLVEQVELLLARLSREWHPPLDLPDPQNYSTLARPELPQPDAWKALPSHQTERKRLARRVERQARYEQVVQLHEAGVKQVEIVRRTGLSERTIRQWLRGNSFPEIRSHPKRQSIFDRYAPYILKRWQAGQHDGHLLWLEIAAQGFKGTERTVQRFLQQLRDNKGEPLNLRAASPLAGVSARQAVWWFIRAPAKLKPEEEENLKLVRKASGSIAEVYRLVQSFMEMVRQQKGTAEKLEAWLDEVKESVFEELQSFVRGIERDKAAVVAGLSLPYCNGLAEGHNNRLKLIKRSMYGRAKLDLLKQRVLARA